MASTPPPTRPLVEELASLSEAVFHAALGRLSEVHDHAGAGGVEVALRLVALMGARAELSSRRQADRLHAILRRLRLAAPALAELGHKARGFSPALRNAVAGFLSPAERRLLLQGDLSQHERPGVGATRSTDTEPTTPAISVSKAREGAPASAEETEGDGNSFTAVVLLASPGQEATRAMLAARKYALFVLSSVDRLEQDLASNGDVCACLVDGSVLGGLRRDQQIELFETIGSYSTFIWLRVDETNLALSAAEVRESLKRTRCLRGEVPAPLLSIQPDGSLREREVDEIEAASKALRAKQGAYFVPGELTADQGNVLMAAARNHARELRFQGQLEMTSLWTKFISGGRSSARIALLRVNVSGPCIVAKIDSKELVLDEMRRFRTFIQEWDDALRPTLHFHGSAAVVLFGLVPHEEDRTRPAEVLAEKLEALWNSELFSSIEPDELGRHGDALSQGIAEAVRRLGELNERQPPSSSLRSLGNPALAQISRLVQSGVDWGMPGIAETLERASSRFDRLALAATIHGDVHLRNILLRAGRDAHLIDYAGSGPGHPSVDLVRLELALFLGPLRQLESEERCVEYQRRLSLEGATYEQLEQEFPALHACQINKVASRGCVAARERALEVLRVHGGEAADYHAAKYLVACQHLVMWGNNTGLARATVEALVDGVASP